MTFFELILLFQVVFNQATLGKVTVMGPPSFDLAATDCATTSQAAFTDHGVPFSDGPFEVTATNTTYADACLEASVQPPTGLALP